MRIITSLVLLGAMAISHSARAANTPPPGVGQRAPDFSLHTLDDKTVTLRALTSGAPVVLVVLRGWPGYQCPLCTKQVHAFVGEAARFSQRGARVVMVYPGPAEQLQAHAREFTSDKQWPESFTLVLDPDYRFTRDYGLRWEAKNETAYPATFIIGTNGVIRFAHVSRSHGDRVSPAEVLSALP